MKSILRGAIASLALLTALFLFGLRTALGAAEPEVAAEQLPRLSPTAPEMALETFQIKPGFKLELVAAEPLVNDPVAMSFDENGRLFVVEMRGYSELRPAKLGRIRMLEDVDGDGRFDKASIYVDQLPWPTAVICYDGGVFVGATPDILYCKDSDGDGRAEVRDVVFTGFASDYAPYETNRLNVQAMLNSFNWGLDNRIHGATSTAGGKVGRPGETTITLRGRDFSFDPRRLDLRPENGGGQHGMSFDSEGRKFVCSNSSHCRAVLYDYRYSGTNPYYALPGASINIAVDGPAAEVFRISPDEPWRVVRTQWRVAGLVPGPVEGGGRPSGYFTAATGITVYRGNAWPGDLEGDLFIADCGSNLIHHKKPRADGVSLKAERPADEKTVEFLASTDNWFRPVQFANAPDGTLYVVDMYREIIEHPWSLPAAIKRHLDLNSGNDRGRIYRVVPEGFQQPRPPALGKLSAVELVATLSHPNGWHRDTASRLLIQRQDQSLLPLLIRSLRTSESAFGRMHALYVLASLGGLTEEVIQRGLHDPAPLVRRHAVRLSETVFANLDIEAQHRQWEYLHPLANDPDDQVRYQLAFTLGTLSHPRRFETWTRLFQRDNSDPWIRAALLNSIGPDAAQLVLMLLQQADGSRADPKLLEEVATMVGAGKEQVRTVLARVADLNQPSVSAAIVSGLGKGLKSQGTSLEALGLREGLEPLFARARQIAGSKENPVGMRLEAIRLLGLSTYAQVHGALELLLSPAESLEIQTAALNALAGYGEEDVGEFLLANWAGFTPGLRTQALNALLARPARVSRLLTAIEEDRVRRSELTSTQVDFLRRHRDKGIRQRASTLLGETTTRDNDALIASYLPALKLKGAMAGGEQTFVERCSSCHKLGDVGHTLGPDLASVRAGGKESILTSLLDPNRAVAPNYLSYEIELRDGSTLLGLMTDETGNSVVVSQANGLQTTVLRSSITRLRSQGLSAMPEGLAVGLSQQQMADLLEYVMKR